MEKKIYRVLHVFSNLGVGGAEIWLIALLRYFKQNDNLLPFQFQFDILLTSDVEGFFDQEAISLGAKLYYLNYRRGNLLNFIIKYRFILANGNYDAIHDHQDFTAGFHFLFGIGYLPPVRIAHIHNPLLHIESYCTTRLRKFTVKIGKELLALLGTHILGTSRQVVSEYGFDDIRFKKLNPGVLYCGFDTTRFEGSTVNSSHDIRAEFKLKKTAKIILFVGRLNSNLNQKNPFFALDVAKACIKIDSDIYFLVAGSGEDIKTAMQNEINSCRLQNNIYLIGSRSDIPKLMQASNLLLFPSIAEGLGMVVIESQSSGLRVLSSDRVPRETLVVPNMVVFKSLEDGILSWAKESLYLINLPRPDLSECNAYIKNSPFSIINSAASLQCIYTRSDRNR